MSGTSQSAAIFTGKLIKYLNDNKRSPQNYGRAGSKLMEAIVKDQQLDHMAVEFLERHLSDEEEKVARWTFSVLSIIQRKRIAFLWRFP
jgi:hypothetical protein